MTITVEAVYEDGVLKPSQPLPFKEHEQLQVTIAPAERSRSNSHDLVKECYGLIKWPGTHEELQRILDELDEDPI